MSKPHNFDISFKFRPDYKWPDPGSERECPRFHHLLELADDRPTYFGKPWWCYRCQWQFAEEDFPDMRCQSKE